MDLNQAFAEVVNSNQGVAVMALVAANFVLGVLAALKDGRFTWAEFSGIITDAKKLTPLVGFLVVSMVGKGMDSPASGVVENGALLAGLPFLISTWKSLKSTGIPAMLSTTFAHTVKEVANTAPPDKDPHLETKSLAVELRDLMDAYAANKITADDVKKQAALLQIAYPGYPGLPSGWPV